MEQQEYLHRQVLSAHGGNKDNTIRRQVRPSYVLEDACGTNHRAYLSAILKNWSGEPDELFVSKNWRRLIRQESKNKQCEDRFVNKKKLKEFVCAIMSLLFDENEFFINDIRDKFTNDQNERFQKLKKEYDDKEVAKLFEDVNGRAESDGNVSDEDSSNESENTLSRGEGMWENYNMNHKGSRSSPNSNPQDESCENGRAGLFEDIRSPKREREGYVKVPPEPYSKPEKKTNKRGIQDDLTKNKKQRSIDHENSHNHRRRRPLDIRISTKGTDPKSFYGKSRKDDNKHMQVHSPLNEVWWGPSSKFENIKDKNISETNESWNDSKDEVYENSTPPYSPSPAPTNAPYRPKTTEYPTKKSKGIRIRPQSLSSESKLAARKSTTATKPIDAFSMFIDQTLTKHSNGELTDLEKENCPRKIFGNVGKNNVRNEPFTHSVSNQTANDENWEDSSSLAPEQHQADKENYPVSAEEITDKYPKPVSAPALTLEMFESIKNTLDKPPKEKVVSGFTLNILQEDLAIISRDTEWLIDLNIDFYLELIQERSKQEGYPKVYIFHSFFYTLLTETDGGYSAVQETTGEDDIFKYDLLFIPVNLNHHWRLVVVRVSEKMLQCYDSMSHSNMDILKNVEDFLNCEYSRKHKGKPKEERPDATKEHEEKETEESATSTELCEPLENCLSWTKDVVPSESIPQQKNAIDCGIFLLQYAEYLSRQHEFDFTQSHIRYFRKRMMYEILTKKLLTSK